MAQTESLATRMARNRQQRSMERTSGTLSNRSTASTSSQDAAKAADPAASRELKILRAEVAESGSTIARLKTQLAQSDAEMEAMGQHTARMSTELKAMQLELDRATRICGVGSEGGSGQGSRRSSGEPVHLHLSICSDDSTPGQATLRLLLPDGEDVTPRGKR